MADIKLLPKPEKDFCLVNCYRTISLLNFIGKVFEKVVHGLFLYEVFRKKNWLRPNQFEFCTRLSLEGAVPKLVSRIKSLTVTGRSAIVISYDIKVDSYNYEWSAMVNIMTKYNFNPYIILFDY